MYRVRFGAPWAGRQGVLIGDGYGTSVGCLLGCTCREECHCPGVMFALAKRRHAGVMRMTTVTFRDETVTGRRLEELAIADLPETMTVRELVRLRVREEVARHNARPSPHFRGLVQPDDAEIELNGYRLRTPRRLEWERQAAIAERAFARNGCSSATGTAGSRARPRRCCSTLRPASAGVPGSWSI